MKYQRSSRAIATIYLTMMAGGLVASFQNCAPGYELTPEAAYSLASENLAPLEVQGTVGSPSNVQTQAFAFKSERTDIVGFRCRLDGKAEETCANPFEITDLTDGRHSLQVMAIKADGFPGAFGMADFILDLAPPVAAVNSFPGAISGNATLEATFSGVDVGTEVKSFECTIDANAAAACTSPFNYPSLSDGPHTFKLVAIDAVGNKSTPVTKTWTVSALAPVIQVTAPGAAVGESTSIPFTATARSGIAVTTTCAFDSAPATACTSPFTAASLSDGNHSLVITASDAIGNNASSNVNFVADRLPPVLSITTANNSVAKDLTYPVSFMTSDRSAVTCQCASGTAPAAACTSPYGATSVPGGTQTVTISCKDAYDNASAPASISFTFDNVAPTLTVTSNMTSPLIGTRIATFNVAVSDDNVRPASVHYMLNGSPLFPFPVMVPLTTVNFMRDGTYTISFRAVDVAGNLSPPVPFTFVVDADPPTKPTNFTWTNTTSTSIEVSWSPSVDVNPGPITYEWKVGSAPESEDLGALRRQTTTTARITTFANADLANPFYYFSIRAIDQYGNASAWQSFLRSWRIDNPSLKCVGGMCRLADLIETTRANLASAAPISKRTFVIGGTAQTVLRSTYSPDLDAYKEFTDAKGGTFTVVCGMNNLIFPCNFSNLTQSFSLLGGRGDFKIVISYDGIPFQTINQPIAFLPRLIDPVNDNAFASTTPSFFARSIGIPSSMTPSKVWVSGGAVVESIFGFCSNSTSPCSLVVGDGSILMAGRVDPISTSVAYVGANAAAFFTFGSRVTDIYVAENALLERPQSTGTTYHLLEGGVPGDPCLTPVGSTCPTNTVYYR